MLVPLLLDVVVVDPVTEVGPYVMIGAVVAGAGLWIIRGRRRRSAGDEGSG